MDNTVIDKIKSEISKIDNDISEREQANFRDRERKKELIIALRVFAEMNGQTQPFVDGESISVSEEIRLFILSRLFITPMTSGGMIRLYAQEKQKPAREVRNLIYQMFNNLTKNAKILRDERTSLYHLMPETPMNLIINDPPNG